MNNSTDWVYDNPNRHDPRISELPENRVPVRFSLGVRNSGISQPHATASSSQEGGISEPPQDRAPVSFSLGGRRRKFVNPPIARVHISSGQQQHAAPRPSRPLQSTSRHYSSRGPYIPSLPPTSQAGLAQWANRPPGSRAPPFPPAPGLPISFSPSPLSGNLLVHQPESYPPSSGRQMVFFPALADPRHPLSRPTGQHLLTLPPGVSSNFSELSSWQAYRHKPTAGGHLSTPQFQRPVDSGAARYPRPRQHSPPTQIPVEGRRPTGREGEPFIFPDPIPTARAALHRFISILHLSPPGNYLVLESGRVRGVELHGMRSEDMEDRHDGNGGGGEGEVEMEGVF